MVWREEKKSFISKEMFFPGCEKKITDEKNIQLYITATIVLYSTFVFFYHFLDISDQIIYLFAFNRWWVRVAN